MRITELTIEVDGSSSLIIRPADSEYPDLYQLLDADEEGAVSIYISKDAAVALVEAIRLMETQNK